MRPNPQICIIGWSFLHGYNNFSKELFYIKKIIIRLYLVLEKFERKCKEKEIKESKELFYKK